MKDEIYLKKLGKKVLHLRKQRGFSQRELARRIGKNNTQIIKIENGTVNPTINTLRSIATAFDMNVGQLVDVV